jgi:hypothetical protein
MNMLSFESLTSYWSAPEVAINVIVFFNLMSALLLGMLVGYERSCHGRAAGRPARVEFYRHRPGQKVRRSDRRTGARARGVRGRAGLPAVARAQLISVPAADATTDCRVPAGEKPVTR